MAAAAEDTIRLRLLNRLNLNLPPDTADLKGQESTLQTRRLWSLSPWNLSSFAPLTAGLMFEKQQNGYQRTGNLTMTIAGTPTQPMHAGIQPPYGPWTAATPILSQVYWVLDRP